LREDAAALRAHWDLEKQVIERIRVSKEGIEQARVELERAERQADLEGAARLKFGTIPELEQELARAQDELMERQADRRMLKEEVDEEDVAEVVATWNGVPLRRLIDGDVEKLDHMQQRLDERPAAHDEARL